MGPGASQRMQVVGEEVSNLFCGLSGPQKGILTAFFCKRILGASQRAATNMWQPLAGVSHRLYNSMVLAAHPCSSSQFLFSWYAN